MALSFGLVFGRSLRNRHDPGGIADFGKKGDTQKGEMI